MYDTLWYASTQLDDLACVFSPYVFTETSVGYRVICISFHIAMIKTKNNSREEGCIMSQYLGV